MEKTRYMEYLYKGYSRKQARELARKEEKREKIKNILLVILLIALFVLSCFNNELPLNY